MATRRAHFCLWFTLALFICAGAVHGQSPPHELTPLVPRDWLLDSPRSGESATSLRSPRLRLLRVPFGYLHDLDAAEPADGPVEPTLLPASDEEGAFLMKMGSDNPYFDFRRPGDPGGVGYYKVQTFVPIFGGEYSELSVGLQAVAPAGLEFDGLPDGHTVLSPTVVWFHDLGGPAVQAFVGQHVPASGRAAEPLQRGWLYGLVLQQPLTDSPGGSLHFFVEAFGRQRRELLTRPGAVPAWELLPGIHWRLNENCWMSGGVILPLGATRFDPGLWQLTCRWQY
jgi:hypothetical protein